MNERPYVVIWYEYMRNIEQVRKYIACLPERIGDRDWKIVVHDHGKKGECTSNCDIINKPGGRPWRLHQGRIDAATHRVKV